MTNAHKAGARPGRLLLLLPVQTAVVAAVGLLITGPLSNHPPLSAEDGVNRALAAHRTPSATWLTDGLSMLADTQSVIALTVLAAVTLLLAPRVPRWREATFLALTVAAQSTVFLLVTLVVNRDRPGVPHLDPAPPTSSFPSGHVGASMALFGGLAVLAARHLRGARRNVVVGLLLLIPLAVAASRVYRGMHHPSDVVAGLLNGACTLALVASALLPTRRQNAEAATDSTRDPHTDVDLDPSSGPNSDVDSAVDAAAGGTRRAVVVRHPHACGDETAARVRAVLQHHGYTEQQWTRTTPEDPSGALAPTLAGTDADLVVVCGGDGTVRACADVVAGTSIPLAIVPCGTGNLLARNLRLPTEPAAALREALSGQTVGLDMGRIRGDGLAPTRFAVMAGAGFDAAMVRDASPRLKESLGWAAYVLSAARHLWDPRMRLSIRLDGGPVLERRARMVVIGNVGTLQGGLPLLPQARPDSGRLDVVLLDPRGVTGWLAAAGYLLSRTSGRRAPYASGAPHESAPCEVGAPGEPAPYTSDARERPVAQGALEYFGATRVDLHFTRPQPREVDGDVFPAGTRLTAEIEPGALRVRLPAPSRTGTPDRAEVPGPADRTAVTGAPGEAGQAVTAATAGTGGTTGREGGDHGHRDARTAAQ
ncbi:diacylglycerol kinase family protein [Streptomyces sp. NPDC002057]|uniref:diacylglycerol kinase family protein n=1 Tax=Streptomyces sp. NPDC002057 TaxID=3154664 RepID=UPI00331E9D82